MASPDPLLDSLRIPGQVVVDDHRAELKIDALCRSLGRDHDRRFVAEILDERRPHVGCARTSDAVGAFVAFDPLLVNRLGFWSVFEPLNRTSLPPYPFSDSRRTRYSWVRRDSVKMIAFSAPPSSTGLGKADAQRAQECFALSVLGDRNGKITKAVKVCDFPLDVGDIRRR